MPVVLGSGKAKGVGERSTSLGVSSPGEETFAAPEPAIQGA
jgi:hypothetical protein